MDIKDIKNLVKNSGAVLVMDNNEPSLVVMDYQIYKNLAQAEPAKVEVHNNGKSNKEELEILERINKDILALKDEIEREEKNLGVGLTD